ncbi:MAG TPA: hypothetical protein VFE65_02840 [Pseudonocardia sp.]|jgi:hypothetical protein|nr:hypothetical protein [Pseudonocardia sp.]
MTDRGELMARMRWNAAEDRLYPALIADPAGYERALGDIHAVVAELRLRAHDFPRLLEAEAAGQELVVDVCPNGSRIPVDLLIGAACAMRAREIAVDSTNAMRTEAS